MWHKNDNGDWSDDYREELWTAERKYSLIIGVVVTVVLVIVSLVKGAGWEKAGAIAISGVLITAAVWLRCSLPLFASWVGAAMAKLVKKIFGIKEESDDYE